MLVEKKTGAGGLCCEQMAGEQGRESGVLERPFLLQTKALVHRSGVKMKIQLTGVFPSVSYSVLGTY